MPEDTSVEERRLAVCCYVGDALCGLDARRVQEVLRVGSVAPVHGAPPHVMGIMNLRGSIVTVLDLRSRLGMGTSVATPDSRIIIVEWGEEMVGLLVEREAGTAEYDPQDRKLAPETVAGAFGAMLHGVYSGGDRLIPLLDVAAVVSAGADTPRGEGSMATCEGSARSV